MFRDSHKAVYSELIHGFSQRSRVRLGLRSINQHSGKPYVSGPKSSANSSAMIGPAFLDKYYRKADSGGRKGPVLPHRPRGGDDLGKDFRDVPRKRAEPNGHSQKEGRVANSGPDQPAPGFYAGYNRLAEEFGLKKVKTPRKPGYEKNDDASPPFGPAGQTKQDLRRHAQGTHSKQPPRPSVPVAAGGQTSPVEDKDQEEAEKAAARSQRSHVSQRFPHIPVLLFWLELEITQLCN